MKVLIIVIVVTLVVILFLCGFKVVRPTHRALVERLGKYHHFANPGLHWIIPIIDRIYRVNVTEQMVDADPQEIITNDNLNATVDAQIYFRVREDEQSVKNSQYNVYNYQVQIVNLARTTLRNIIGTLTLKSANSERGRINTELHQILSEETTDWGISTVRAELKQIDPPQDVQATMNKVVKAENEKMVKFITENLSLTEDSLTPYVPFLFTGAEKSDTHVQLRPDKFGTDGFFVARFLRK